jgi:hypothetical protein
MSMILRRGRRGDFGFPIRLDSSSDLELSALERLDTADFECDFSYRLEMVVKKGYNQTVMVLYIGKHRG